jgi:hypothetical protein
MPFPRRLHGAATGAAALLVLLGAAALAPLPAAAEPAATPDDPVGDDSGDGTAREGGSRAPGDADLVTFGIAPASSGVADQRAYLTYGVTPGAVVFDAVALVNQSDQPLDLLVYAADGVNAEGGGLDVRPRAEASTDIGSWVTVAGEQEPVRVSVPPQDAEAGRGEVVLPFEVAVPANATPGDHVGGVVASLVARGENPEAQNIELEQRVAVRLYFRVDGPLSPALDVDVLDVSYVPGTRLWEPGRVDLTYRVTNSGNTRLGVDSTVSVRGPFGLGARSGDGPTVEEIVPNGGSVTLEATVTEVRPLVRMSASVTVSATPAPGAEDFDAAADARRSFWALHRDLLVLAAVVLLLAAAVVIVVVVRRRRGAGSGPGARPGSPPADPHPAPVAAEVGT